MWPCGRSADVAVSSKGGGGEALWGTDANQSTRDAHAGDDARRRPLSRPDRVVGSSEEMKVQLSMRIGKRTLLLGVTGLASLSMLGAAFAFAHVTGTRAASDGGFTRTISKGGTGSLSGSAGQGADVAFQSPEFSDAAQGESADAGGGDSGHTGVDRSFSGATTGKGRVVDSGKQAKSNPELNLSFNGLNFRQQRLANGGNQFSVEPP